MFLRRGCFSGNGKGQKIHLYRLDTNYFLERGCFTGNGEGQKYMRSLSEHLIVEEAIRIRTLIPELISGERGLFSGNWQGLNS
jgi:hypothetical protein